MMPLSSNSKAKSTSTLAPPFRSGADVGGDHDLATVEPQDECLVVRLVVVVEGDGAPGQRPVVRLGEGVTELLRIGGAGPVDRVCDHPDRVVSLEGLVGR